MDAHLTERYREAQKNALYFRDLSFKDEPDAALLAHLFEELANNIALVKEGEYVPVTAVNPATIGGASQDIPDGATNVWFETDEDPTNFTHVELTGRDDRVEHFPIAEKEDLGGGDWRVRVDSIVLTKIKATGDGNPKPVKLVNLSEEFGVTYANTNIRLKQVLGIRTTGQTWRDNGWIDTWWPLANRIITARPQAFSEDWLSFGVAISLSARGLMVDHNLTMTTSELRDWTHPNYRWNANNNGILQALTDSRVIDNNIKFTIVLADSASGTTRAQPGAWPDSDWFSSQRNYPRNQVLRYEQPETRARTVALHLALLDWIANTPAANERIAQFVFSEYYTGPPSDSTRTYHPAGFDNNAHAEARAQMWQEVVDGAPLDANGNRIAMSQKNPRFLGSVNLQTMINAGIGISRPDPETFNSTCGVGANISEIETSCPINSTGGAFQSMFGSLPTYPANDSRYAREQRPMGRSDSATNWTDPAIFPNPFGLSAGDRPKLSMQKLAWYNTHIEPVDSATFTIDMTGDPLPNHWDEDAFIEMITMFGPGGTDLQDGKTFPRRVGQ